MNLSHLFHGQPKIDVTAATTVLQAAQEQVQQATDGLSPQSQGDELQYRFHKQNAGLIPGAVMHKPMHRTGSVSKDADTGVPTQADIMVLRPLATGHHYLPCERFTIATQGDRRTVTWDNHLTTRTVQQNAYTGEVLDYQVADSVLGRADERAAEQRLNAPLPPMQVELPSYPTLVIVSTPPKST